MLFRSGMKSGEVRIRKSKANRLELIFGNNGSFIFKNFSSSRSSEVVEIIYQEKADSWVSIKVSGLRSDNVINRGKGISTKAHGALDDSEETELLIPINNAVYSSMRLVDRTQLGVTMSYMVLNYYKEYKVKWYQRSFGKAFIIDRKSVV